MHLRKTRKAKAAASEFVKRVISGKDVSPDRRGPAVTTSRTAKTSGSKQSAKATSSRGKPASRGGARSPKPAPTTALSGSTRSTSRSPSVAPEQKAKTQVQKAKAETVAKSPARRGRPPKNTQPESPTTQTTAKATKGENVKASVKPTEKEKPKRATPEKCKREDTEKLKKAEPVKSNEAIPEVKDKQKSCKSHKASPIAKILPSVKGKSTDGLSTKGSAAAKALCKVSKRDSPDETEASPSTVISQCDEKSDKVAPSSPCTSSETPIKPVQIITPHIVFVDRNSQDTPVPSPTHQPVSPVVYGDRMSASPQGFRSVTPIKISPTAKLIPVSSFSNINTAGKSVFTISIPGSSLAKTVGQGSTQFIVSAQPIGSTNASPIKVTATTRGSSPGHVTLDLAELAKSVTALTPLISVPEKLDASIIVPSSPSPPTPIINKSPKFLLSSTKHSKRDELVSEGKIKKRRRSKTPAWDVPSAVYKSLFNKPQPEFIRKDDEIKYPENANMEQTDYFKVMGIINKSDIKKLDGTEHRNHRLAGGKLRRVCKPKISPEMVYRRFSLARGCIMHDVFVDSDEDNNDRVHNPRVVIDKTAIIKTEQTKKRSLSPKMHDSYKQHCNKIPVITIEKVAKDGLSSVGENSPAKPGVVNSLKENHPPCSGIRRDWESGEGCSSGSARRKGLNPSRKPATQSPKSKAKLGGVKKHIDTKQGGSKLVKSKSFDVCKKSSAKPSSMAKSKSFERFSGASKGESSKQKSVVPKIEPDEEKDGARRSARNRGSKRKQWWHLLRANPDEFEEDKVWNKEVAVQEEKRKARLERALERADGGESPIEQEELPEAVVEKEPIKKLKKKLKVKKDPDCVGDEVDPKSYTELYETKLKKKKKRSTDWALAKQVLEEAQAKAKAKEDGEETGKVLKSTSKGGNKDGGFKRKACDSLDGDIFTKKIKTEPLSEAESDDDALGEKQGSKLKRKRGISGVELDELIDEKPEIITNLVILGENGEPLQAKSNSNLYDQLQSILEGKDCDNLSQTGVLELTAPPDSPQSFIEILARQQQQKKRRPRSTFGMLPIVRSDVLYKTKEAECIAPHICSVCWVNDHMYCRNMKRIARDLPLCGGCIHYVPCGHYRQKMSPSIIDRKQMQRRIRRSLYAKVGNGHGEETVVSLTEPCSSSTFASPTAQMINFSTGDESDQIHTSRSDDPLLCDEILTESDSEPSSPEAPAPPGTELLRAEIRARGNQIKCALGFKSLPQTISPLKRKLQWASPKKVFEPISEDNTSQEDEDDSADVIVSEYALEETIYFGKNTVDVDYGVPLSDKFIVESLVSNESWLTGTSIFMPNTESDASNDSHEISPEPTPVAQRSTATEHTYEESVFGENSQDSTETSLSQISTHVESDDSDPDRLIGESQVSWCEEKHRRKKKRAAANVIHVKSLGLGDGSDISFKGLKNKWQQGEDGTQVLTFTTKEIRERKPELLAYIKRAGLLNVISEKLCLEKSSIKKLYKENETTMRQSQDKLEQHRCLMAAVLTEILSVKEQLRDLQTALIDEESVCAKLRKESRDIAMQCTMAEEKVRVLKKITTQAQDRGLMSQPVPKQTGVSSGVQAQDATTATLVKMSDEATTGVLVDSLHEGLQVPNVENIDMLIDTVTAVETTMVPMGGQTIELGGQSLEAGGQTVAVVGQTVEVGDQSMDVEGQTMSVSLEQTVQPVGVANEQSMHSVYGTEVHVAPSQQPCIGMSMAPVSTAPISTASIATTPTLPTGPVPIVEHTMEQKQEDASRISQELESGENGQVVSVPIEGGRSVMLELPKDLLQCEASTGTRLTSLGEAGESVLVSDETLRATGNPLHHMEEGDLGAVFVETLDVPSDTVPQEMMHIMQAGGQEVVVSGQSTCDQVARGQVTTAHLPQTLQHISPAQQTGVTDVSLGAAQPQHNNEMLLQAADSTRSLYVRTPGSLQHEISADSLTGLQQVKVQIPTESQSTGHLDSVAVDNPDLTLPQPIMEGSLKQAATDFDNMIMRPGDLGDVILQANDMSALSLQQGDMGNLVVQHGDLPLSVDAAGLNTYLTTQLVNDNGILVHQDVGDNYMIHQQGAVHMQHDSQPIIIQEASGGLFVPDTNSLHHQATNSSVVHRPQSSNPQNIMIQQEPATSQNIVIQQQPQHLTQQHQVENMILRTDTVSATSTSAGRSMMVAEEQAVQHQMVQHQVVQHQAVQHQAVQHQAVQHQAVQHQAVKHQAVQHQAVQHQAVQHQAVQHQAVQHQAVQHQAVQHQAVQHQAVQHQAVQHQAVQHQAVQHQAVQHQAVQHQAVQQPLVDQPGPMLTQQGHDIILQNVDFLHGQVGQVQTIMIDGQAYQVIIQDPETV